MRNLAEFKEEDFYAELQSILTALEYLPKRTETDPKRIAERIREKEIIKRRLERRCAEAPQVQQAIEKALAQINGEPGDPRSFDALDELLNAQSYRLAFWRVAAEEINYRRFFDVNDLAAIRVELPEVFDAIHRLAPRAGRRTCAVTGLRIDHPDGLYLPREYFEKLQQRCAKALGIRFAKDGRAIYMVAEKILTGPETLRKDWPVHGTTGYDFANQVAQLLVDSSAEAAITKTFHRFIGHSLHVWASAVCEKAAGDEIVTGQRRQCSGQHGRPAFRAKPMVSRFHARSAGPRRARDDRLFSGLSNLSRARRSR